MEKKAYNFSNYAIALVIVLSLILSITFKWTGSNGPVNFMDGDAQDYYSPLVSIFINHDFQHQQANEWFLLQTNSGVINVHSIGIAILLLPFFLIAYLISSLLGSVGDGYGLPFQIAVASAALFYALLGLTFLKRLFKIHDISDKVTAFIIFLIYFGTNLVHYTVSEAGMSHVYSFALISAFLFFSSRFVMQVQNKDMLISSALLGLILLVRPNNVFVVFTILFWFKSAKHCKEFFLGLFRNRNYYYGLAITVTLLSLQALVWYIQSGSLVQNTYKRDGFYWTDPQLMEMLFGFDGGFFIYTPLCLLMLGGLFVIYRQNKFSFFAMSAFLMSLFYFFSSYWAYTYFDGLGIRVLVDYYAIFAFAGGKLFSMPGIKTFAFTSITSIALFFTFLNAVYCYQANQSILLRAGMTYKMWKYVFLKTGAEFRNSLGGSHELKPFAKQEPALALNNEAALAEAFNFSQNEYGPNVVFDKMGFDSNRIRLNLTCQRKEMYLNSSAKVQVCVAVEDPLTKEKRTYVQFKLNETPSENCCESIAYNYTANVVGDFKAGDKLSVYLWNIDKQPFLLEKLAVKVYDYNYNLN